MENQKRYDKSQSPVIIIDSYVVGAADIMRTLLLLNEESFVCLVVCFFYHKPENCYSSMDVWPIVGTR